MGTKEEKFKKIYWLKNFETWENLTFSEDKISEDKLREYNEKGYNIYQTVNTFIWNKRQIKDLAEIRACFVDIDYPEIADKDMDKEQRAEFIKGKYEEVQANLKKIKDLYWIEPSLINLTYKGFHILFNYSENCYFIKTEIHKEVNDKLVKVLWGDENAKDIARVYKVPGFYDWKGWKRWKIKTIKEHHTSEISKSIIEGKFLFPFKERNLSIVNEKVGKNEIKKDKTVKNIEKINNIDALDFIENIVKVLGYELNKLNLENKKDEDKIKELKLILNKLKYTKEEDKLILCEEDGITLTSGLFLEQDFSGIWKINDYSKKTRRGNYNFLKNWILKDINNKDLEFFKLIYKITGFTLNIDLEKKAEIDFKILSDHVNNRYKDKSDNNNKEVTNFLFSQELDKKPTFLEEKDTLIDNKLEEIKADNQKFKKLKAKSSIIMVGLLNFIKTKRIKEDIIFIDDDKKETKKVGYKIIWKDFFDYFGERQDDEHRRIKKMEYSILLKYCSLLQYKITRKIKLNSNEPPIDMEIDSNIFNVGHSKLKQQDFHRGVRDFFIILPIIEENFNFWKLGYFNKNILTAKIKDEAKELALYINWVLWNTSSENCILSFKQVKEYLNLNSEDEKITTKNIRYNLNKLQENDLIKNFIINQKDKKIIITKY